MNKKYLIALSSLILILFIVNYPIMDSWVVKFFEEDNYVVVSRVIDGDTIVADGETIRLLGINSPERGEKYYSEAKEFLENLILNKTVFIESFGKDKYYRDLGFVFLGNENVNIKMIEKGFANVYILDNKKHEEELRNAWEDCENYLCEKSRDKCASCISLEEFGYNKNVVLKNKCGFDCSLSGWEVKDEGRKNFIFPDFVLESGKEVSLIVGNGINSKDELFWFGENYVWTKTGDTIIIRDSNYKLVLWKSY